MAGCPRRGVSAHDGEDVAAHERDGGGLQRPGHGDKLLRRQLPGGGAFRLMCHLHSSIGSTRGWTRYKRCRGISGRDGARRDAVASARELDRAHGDNGASPRGKRKVTSTMTHQINGKVDALKGTTVALWTS